MTGLFRLLTWQQEFDLTFRRMHEHNLFPEVVRGKAKEKHDGPEKGVLPGVGKEDSGKGQGVRNVRKPK